MVTLPVEWDASRRAKQQLLSMGIVQRDEAGAVEQGFERGRSDLRRGYGQFVMSLLYFLSILRGTDRD